MTDNNEGQLKSISMISYIMHAVVAIAALVPGVQASVGLLLVAMVLDLATRGGAKGTWLESHFAYRLRSVFIAGIAYAVTSPLWLMLVVPGWIAWTLISAWFAYRIFVGFMKLGERAAV